MSSPAVVKALRAWDGLRNLVSGVGTAKDKASQWRYVYEPIDDQQIHAMYASDWLARKIVDIVPEDMTREWRIWQSERSEDYYKAERQLRIRTKIQEALTIARLDGGAAILIGDGKKDPERQFDVGLLGKDGIKYLHVFSKSELVGKDPIKDINSPDYLKNEFYTITTEQEGPASTRQTPIHRSRFVFIKGAKIPRSLVGVRDADCEWGLSIFQAIAAAIRDAGGVAANSASLTNEAKMDILKIPELDQRLSDDEGTRRLTERLTLANTMKSTINTLIIGNDEEWDRKEVNLASFPDLMRAHLQVASGAADIPVTRLLGQSPAGMNATGESDIRNYYDMIRSKQKGFEEDLEPIDRALMRHVTGAEPEGDTYEWIPLWQMSETEEATIAKTKADAIQIYLNTNLFAPEEMRPSIADMLIEDAFLPTLDQHLLTPEDFSTLLEERQQAQQEQQQAQLEAQAQATNQGSQGSQGDPGGGQGLKVIKGGRQDSAPPAKSDEDDKKKKDPRATPFESGDSSQEDGLGDFEESEHPRSLKGEFLEKGGGDPFLKTWARVDLVPAGDDRSKWPPHVQALKIPPAWTNVKVNKDPKAALQAIGKDSKGRDQYVYSEEFKQAQQGIKFARVKELVGKYETIEAQNKANLSSEDDSLRQHAEVTHLIMTMGLRPGSTEDQKAAVKAYGVTTLEGRHVTKGASETRLKFIGKKGVALDLKVKDETAAQILRERAQAAEYRTQLFPEVSDRSLRDYVKTLNGGDFKPKDFRTALATTEAEKLVRTEKKKPRTQKEYKAAVLKVAKAVSSRLGNTPTVALQSYIHPTVFAPWRLAA